MSALSFRACEAFFDLTRKSQAVELVDDASEGEGELTIDLGGGKQSTITMPQQQQQLPPEPSREADLTAASEAERLLIARQQQQRNSGGNNNNSILQRYLNELPETEAALTAAVAAEGGS